jgi:hypothetical protein
VLLHARFAFSALFAQAGKAQVLTFFGSTATNIPFSAVRAESFWNSAAR